MYRGQMTDTELEAFYMQGEFKPEMKISELDPVQMLDSELREAMKEYQGENTVKSDRRKTRVLAEYSRRFLRR